MTAAGATIAIHEAEGPSRRARVAGLLGVVGGTALLAAFVIDIPPWLNDVRLALFFVGSMAVAAAAYPPVARTGLGVARVAVGLVLVANAWGLAMGAISTAFSIPVGPGTFGVVYFGAGLAWWLADAFFGFVAIRVGGWARVGALALAVGSVLAITGMDRLELTTRDNPTTFVPLSLTGIALNGAGWIVLGFWLVSRRERP
jgi:hypothetical protein